MSSENQIEFTKDYPGAAKEENISEIAENLQKKTNKAAILMQLKEQALTEDQQ